MWPGTLATAFRMLAAQYFWFEPRRSWAVTNAFDVAALLTFAMLGVIISALNEAWRRTVVAVSESEERTHVTLTSIGDAVIATDRGGRISSMNPVAQRLTGWNASEAIGKPLNGVFAIIDERTRTPVENPVDRVLREGVVVGLANHTLLISKGSVEIPIDDSAAPIRGADGLVRGAVIVFRDITDRRRGEQEHEAKERVARQLAAIVESSDDPIVGKSLDGVIRSWNRAAEQMFGYSATEAIGQSIRLIIPNDRWAEEDEILSGIGRGDRVQHFETVRVRKDGTQIPVSLTISPVLDSNDRVIGASTIARDITERKRIEEEQRRSREQLRLAVEAAPAAVIMVDQHGIMVMANALTERLRGYTREQLLGESIERLVPGRFRDRHVADRNGFFGDPRQRPMGTGRELFAVRHDGSEVPVEIGLSPIQFEGRAYVLAAVTDISERKALEHERAAFLAREQAARAEMERASRLKDEFLAVLSHELRTPLNAVLGYATLLNTGSLPPERTAHALKAIQRNAEAQARLVESLLDISRIMAGKLELNIERVQLLPIVEAAIDVVRPEAESKRVTVTLVPRSDIAVDGDAGRLQQVFWNLLANAVKFTPPGGSVDVQLNTRDGEALLEVTDTGQGIRAEFLPYVFDRFSQADGRQRRSPSGLGLGLALVREIVQAHGGAVTVHSAGEGCGSTFTILLPLSTLPDTTPAVPSESAFAAKPTALAGIEVLVVDDEKDVRDLMRLVLESRGASVRTASSTRDALHAVRDRRPDVILADLRMPEEDGYALIHQLREREGEGADSRLPAIAVTAYASTSDRERAMVAGFDWHVTKPLDPEDLIRAVLKVRNEQSA